LEREAVALGRGGVVDKNGGGGGNGGGGWEQGGGGGVRNDGLRGCEQACPGQI